LYNFLSKTFVYFFISSPQKVEDCNLHSMGSIEEEKDFVEKKQYNVFRDSPIRWCGYANEIGESFRYQVSVL